MKTYFEHKDVLIFENICHLKDPLSPNYQAVLEEVEKGEAVIMPYVPPSQTWEEIRLFRDQLLSESDWTVTIDANPKPSKEAWLNYRQALRDIPQVFSTSESVVWPTKPS
jgi:hypothetical protein